MRAVFADQKNAPKGLGLAHLVRCGGAAAERDVPEGGAPSASAG